MARSTPFSLRLSPQLDARISALAERSKRSKAAVLENLADEADRCRRYPGIAFRGPDWDRRAWAIGTGLDVWEIIRALQDFAGSVERMAEETEISTPEIELAEAYCREFQDEINSAITLDRRSLLQLQQEYPFIGAMVIDA
ncbi:MAG TPA: hypothetical protein VG015_07125 [Candidatus Dormibacteraeota bacterium]|jgi:hypothetical protein|nr:hypothetical protein [Candidatus Dormibacteraeota bacterium]